MRDASDARDSRDALKWSRIGRGGVGSLARQIGMSARSLRRHCANAGLNLAERRTALRIEELERLLSMGLPVRVIAHRLGFSS